MELTDPAGSLATPSDATGSLTVGAVYWRDSQLEPFSSHGPTTDNRIKPDLVGPDGVSNAIYAPDRFYGTSAAAPHITGAAALVWSAYPDSTGQEIKDFLMANTVDLLEPGPDPETGAGVLELPAPPPQPTPLPPTSAAAPGETPASPLATPTPRKIVIIASPAAPLPRPPVATPPNGNGNLIGLGALAIVLGIIGWAGLRMALHARGEASPQPHGFRAEITRKATGQSRSSSSAMQAACAYCGRAQSADAVFCTQCGRPFGAAITLTKCPRCARALRPGARYCTHCGQPAA